MKLYSLIASGVTLIQPTSADLKASGAPELVIKELQGHANASFIRIRLSPTDAPNVNGDWVTAEGAAKRIKSLILQPVNLAANLTEHNKLEPIGVVYNAFLDEKNGDIMADAVLWKRYFPDEVAVIEAMKDQLGGSWEIAADEKGLRFIDAAIAKEMNIDAEKIRMIEDDYDFTGFSILKQTAAAAQFRTKVEELVASRKGSGGDKTDDDKNKGKEVKANMFQPIKIETEAQYKELIASIMKESDQTKRIEALEASDKQYKADLQAAKDTNAKVVAALAELVPAEKRSTDPLAMAQALKDAEASKTVRIEAEKQFKAIEKEYDEKDKDEVISIIEAGIRKEMTAEQALKLSNMRKGASAPATKGIHASVDGDDLTPEKIDATASRMAGKSNDGGVKDMIAAAVTAAMSAVSGKK